MAQQTINTGSAANDGTGDDIRAAWTKANSNFTELYSGVAVDATNVQSAGALMDSEVTNLADVKAFDPANYATAAQGSTADTALQPGDSIGDLSDVVIAGVTDGQLLAWSNANGQFEVVDPAAAGGSVDSVNGFTGAVVLDADDIDDAATVNKFVTQAQIDKLTGIEANATADQTGAEIKTAYEGETDTNAFTDSEKSKLSGIEASADVTDTANVTAAGALMDSEVTNLADVKAFDPADYATAAQGSTADTALQSVAGDATPQLAGELDAQGEVIGGFLGKVVTGVSGALTAAAHSGNLLITSGNVTVPTTTGFTCQIEAGGAHTVTFNSTTSAAMAAGDVMSIVVTSGTTIRASLIAAASQVEFT